MERNSDAYELNMSYLLQCNGFSDSPYSNDFSFQIYLNISLLKITTSLGGCKTTSSFSVYSSHQIHARHNAGEKYYLDQDYLLLVVQYFIGKVKNNICL